MEGAGHQGRVSLKKLAQVAQIPGTEAQVGFRIIHHGEGIVLHVQLAGNPLRGVGHQLHQSAGAHAALRIGAIGAFVEDNGGHIGGLQVVFPGILLNQVPVHHGIGLNDPLLGFGPLLHPLGDIRPHHALRGHQPADDQRHHAQGNGQPQGHAVGQLALAGLAGLRGQAVPVHGFRRLLQGPLGKLRPGRVGNPRLGRSARRTCVLCRGFPAGHPLLGRGAVVAVPRHGGGRRFRRRLRFPGGNAAHGLLWFRGLITFSAPVAHGGGRFHGCSFVGPPGGVLLPVRGECCP